MSNRELVVRLLRGLQALARDRLAEVERVASLYPDAARVRAPYLGP